MVGRFLTVFYGGLIVGAGDHGSVAEHSDFHVTQRGRVYVGGLYLGGPFGLGLALAVRSDGHPVICYEFLECCHVVIFLSIEPSPFYRLQSFRDAGIRVGLGLLGVCGHRSGENQTQETGGSDESSLHIGAPCKSPPLYCARGREGTALL